MWSFLIQDSVKQTRNSKMSAGNNGKNVFPLGFASATLPPSILPSSQDLEV